MTTTTLKTPVRILLLLLLFRCCDIMARHLCRVAATLPGRVGWFWFVLVGLGKAFLLRDYVSFAYIYTFRSKARRDFSFEATITWHPFEMCARNVRAC